MRKLCLGVIIVGLAVFLRSGIGSAQQKFRIGCADPLTGTFGRDGNLVKDAYTFWADLDQFKGRHRGQREEDTLLSLSSSTTNRLPLKMQNSRKN